MIGEEYTPNVDQRSRGGVRGALMRGAFGFVVGFAAVSLLPVLALAQPSTGVLIGTLKDSQGGVLSAAVVRVRSPSLIGGTPVTTTNARGQLRFPALPPGVYGLDIEMQGFARHHEEGIHIGVGATLERTIVLPVAGVEESLILEGAGSRIEARESGFGTRFGPDDLKAIPVRRFSMSAFGSGTTDNIFSQNFGRPSVFVDPRRAMFGVRLNLGR